MPGFDLQVGDFMEWHAVAYEYVDDKTQESTERWAMKWRKVLLLTWYWP